MSDTAAKPLQTFSVPFDSMEPTIPTGSEVVGDVSYYSKHKPQRWDVVVFSLPGSESRTFVKRIVGLPGETIHVTHRGLMINGAMMPVPPKLRGFSSPKKHDDHKYGRDSFKIPADSVFVMGDNAEVYQADSREFGAVPIGNLKARILATVSVTPIV